MPSARHELTTQQLSLRYGAGELFQVLRDGRAWTRAELMRETGLSRTSVSERLNDLLGTGLVVPTSDGVSSGGRPPSRVKFNAASRVAIGVDLGATHGAVGLTDLNGTILAHRRKALEISLGPRPVLSWALETAEELLTEIRREPEDVLGVGVGVPGPVQHSTGIPIRPPIMPGWDGFDVPGFIAQTFPQPVLVDNDVNILALGERETVWPSVDDLLFVKVATGIGAGVIAGGVLQRGAQGAAGDIGHVQVPHGDSESDLEATASGPAIGNRLKTESRKPLNTQEVIDRIRIGDAEAVAAARAAGRAIGEVVAICVSMLNPTTIVVGGAMGISVEELIAGIREVVYKRAIPLATQHLNVVPAQGGQNAGIRGATLMVIENQLSARSIERLITC